MIFSPFYQAKNILFNFIFQVSVQTAIRIPIWTETTAVKVAKKKTIRHKVVLSAMGVKSESIANAAKETSTQDAQIHHVKVFYFTYRERNENEN